MAHFSLAPNNISLSDVLWFIYAFPLKDIVVVSRNCELWVKLLLSTSMCSFLGGLKFSSHLGKYQGVWLLDHIKSKFSKKLIKPSSKVVHHFAFAWAMNKGPYCPVSSPAFGVLDVGHSNRWVVAFILVLMFQFPHDIRRWASFHMSIHHEYIFLGEL